MPTEDHSKVRAKLDELNGGSLGGLIHVRSVEWVALEGFNALTKFDFLSNGGAVFTPTAGYPVKIFVNTSTGEMKIFPAAQFLRNH